MHKENVSRITEKIQELLNQKQSVIIAIDGRCGSGKTTLAKELQKNISCNVIHMDDFFLRPEQRTSVRLETPGENIDHERFLGQVLIPLSENKPFSYRPYNCSTQSLGETVGIVPCAVTVVEGSYSCHPQLWDFYDLHIFLDIDSETQMDRIISRNGADGAIAFRDKWIPLEEQYFFAYSVKLRCELQL